MSTWLIGTGYMAKEYAKVLKALNIKFITIGRGNASAIDFEASTCVAVERGGIAAYLRICADRTPRNAIVAVSVEELARTVNTLLELGVKSILVEKPAGIDSNEIHAINETAIELGAKVYVAYNRRFYSSVRMAKEILEEDGGVKSFNFEFTEWAHEIEPLNKARGIKENWLLNNSTHVIDLAFYLGGRPTHLHSYHAGSLSWHPNASVFVGSGKTESGALFSYQANWDAPGRWGLELCSKNYRLIFRPIEELKILRKGSLIIEEVQVKNSDIDRLYKPGLLLQTKSFLNGDCGILCEINEHAEMVSIYNKIGGYKIHN